MAVKYASSVIVIVFGAWFAQVLIQTGIAESVIRSAVELTGGRPMITAMVINLVTALLFTSMYGVGAAIAIGVIALPIMMSQGIPARVAAPTFSMAIGAGAFVNLVQFGTFEKLFPGIKYEAPWLTYWMVGVCVYIAIAWLMIYLNLRKLGVRRAPASIQPRPDKHLASARLTTPTSCRVSGADDHGAQVGDHSRRFLVSIVLALVLTARDRTLQGHLNLFNKTFYDAFPDIATIAALWTICGMIIVAGQMPQVADALKPIFSPVLPHNTAQAAVFFGVLGGILSIYRGPLVVVGTGAALLAILLVGRRDSGASPVLAVARADGHAGQRRPDQLVDLVDDRLHQGLAGSVPENRIAVRLAHGRHLLGDLLRVAGPPLSMTEGRTYRIGIDVGGTFTKAVLIDNATYEVVGRYSVLTTHSDPRGVAKGVVEVFRNVLERSAVDPADVVFLAHSTTQATNALLEGDVAAVGIIGMASRVEALLARSQSSIKEIELAPGRYLRPRHHFITRDGLDETTVRAALEEMRGAGVQVVVATSAFGVDDQSGEELVMREASRARHGRHRRTRDQQAVRLDHAHAHRRDQRQHPAEDDRHRRHDRGERARGRHRRAADDHARGRRRDGRAGNAAPAGGDDAFRTGRQRGRRADVSEGIRRHLLRGRRHQHQYRRDPQRTPDGEACAGGRTRHLRQLARRAGAWHRGGQHGAGARQRDRRRRPPQRAHRGTALRRLRRGRGHPVTGARIVQPEAGRPRRLRRGAHGEWHALRDHEHVCRQCP